MGNAFELINYLDSLGIDANRVRSAGMSPEGYDYIQIADNGRPLHGPGNRLITARVEWPSREVFEKVWLLHTGKAYVAEETEKAEEPVEPEVKAETPKPPRATSTKAAAPRKDGK